MNKHSFTEIQRYGVNEQGQYVAINDVADNGKACNCKCPICGESLIARKGNGGKTPHFAHEKDSKCLHAEYIKQTNIHCMAEEIFLEEKEIIIPPIIEEAGNYNAVFESGGKYKIDKTELEKKISDFIPDIILYIGNSIVLVEIYVTHAVDENKLRKIEEAKDYYVIEIDLSELVHEDISYEQLRIHLKEIQRYKWIYNPNYLLLLNNFEKSTSRIPIEKNTNIVTQCPLNRSGIIKRFENCKRCRCYLGIYDSAVYCAYNFLFSVYNGRILFPKMYPRINDFEVLVLPVSTQIAFALNSRHINHNQKYVLDDLDTPRKQTRVYNRNNRKKTWNKYNSHSKYRR